MMTLFGSTTSPYVRRLRMLMAGQDYIFEDLKILDPEDRAKIASINPTMKIPMLQDGEQVIFDSRMIFRYLNQTLFQQGLDWQQENQLTLIDSVNDSLVQLFILKASNIDVTQSKLYFDMQRERAKAVFDELDKQVGQGQFNEWGYPLICLYCLLDWVVFRDMFDVSVHQNLQEFLAKHGQDERVLETDPRP